jgi:UDP-glucose 4-epimerase
MKVLVTGASGFLGESLVGRLLDDGDEVVVIGRSEAKERANEKYTFVKADITDNQALQEVHKNFPAIDTIVHLAALVPKTKDEDVAPAMFDANVRGTINLLETFGDGLKNFVYASTAEVYGLPEADGKITETMLAKPLSYYGASKLAGELFCNVYSARHELPISMLRFTVLYGPGDRINRAVPNFIKKALAGENLQIFGGEELRDYLHVSDAARAVYLAAKKPVSGVFNIGTGKGITIRETAEKIVEMVGNSDVKADIQPREKKAADIVLDVDRATTELGFTAEHIFPELLDEQIEWHRQQA